MTTELYERALPILREVGDRVGEAVTLHNLAVRLGEVGRRAEGLAAAQEAVDLRRELAAGHRDAYLPDLAASVNNLAVQALVAAFAADKTIVDENSARAAVAEVTTE